mmetsp:Transcript_3596/g.11151  ORF Transcript_3596/g.11151 Transcript_3596/m.11151 type:complete len:283 (+) Transcript_3596:161-1009(+)
MLGAASRLGVLAVVAAAQPASWDPVAVTQEYCPDCAASCVAQKAGTGRPRCRSHQGWSESKCSRKDALPNWGAVWCDASPPTTQPSVQPTAWDRDAQRAMLCPQVPNCDCVALRDDRSTPQCKSWSEAQCARKSAGNRWNTVWCEDEQTSPSPELTCADVNCAECFFLKTDGTRGCKKGGYGAAKDTCDARASLAAWELTIWCGPTEAPTDAPTEAPTDVSTEMPTEPPECDGACCDSSSYRKNNKEDRSCVWVGEKPDKRCDGERLTACPATCGTCPVQTR